MGLERPRRTANQTDNKKTEPRKGRPTLYRPEMCEQVIALGRAGKSKTQIAAAMGTSTVNLWNWSNANPEFAEAMKLAKELEQAWWEDKGQDGIKDRSFNSTAFIFQMKNRFRDQYFDHQVVTGPGGTPVQQIILDPAKLKKMSDKDLESIAGNITKLQKGVTGAAEAKASGEEAYAATITKPVKGSK